MKKIMVINIYIILGLQRKYERQRSRSKATSQNGQCNWSEPHYLLNHIVFELVTRLTEKTVQFQKAWVKQYLISWFLPHMLSSNFTKVSKITQVLAFSFKFNSNRDIRNLKDRDISIV